MSLKALSTIRAGLYFRVALTALVAGLFAVTVSAQADFSTNLFVTFPPHEMVHAVTPEKIAEAKQAKESRPAEKDPEGNWGLATAGFQMSVRFEKETYKVGEPITATVLIRDVIEKPVYYRDFPADFRGVKTDSPLCNLAVLDEQGKRVPRMQREPEDVTDGPHIPRMMNPGTQHKYEIKLDGRFNLSQPGKYTIQARRQVHKLQGDGYTNITSGTATIKIVASQP